MNKKTKAAQVRKETKATQISKETKATRRQQARAVRAEGE